MKHQSTINLFLALTLTHLIFGQIQAQINWQSGGDRVKWLIDFIYTYVKKM